MIFRMPLIMTLLTALAGCSSHVVQQEQFSGFLSDYSQLTEVETASEGAALRWVNPKLKNKSYDSLILEKTVLYPKPQSDQQVTKEFLNKFTQRIDKHLAASTQPGFKLVNKPGKNVLIVRPAVTGVSHSREGMKPIEVLPVALVIGVGKVVAGTRDHDVEVFLEAEMVDSLTGEVMVQVIRKAEGEQLENDTEKLSMKHLQSIIDNWGKDAQAVFASIALENSK